MKSRASTADPGPAVEAEVVADMARRALPAFPVLILAAGLLWGVDGALSAGFAIILAVANLALSAALLAWAARVSLALLVAASLGGFVLRLALLTVVVFAVADHAWVEMVPLGLTLAVAHVGMLVWEARHVSASLAFPGLKPTPSNLAGGRR